MQQRFSTCNAVMLRCKLEQFVARIISPLPHNILLPACKLPLFLELQDAKLVALYLLASPLIWENH